MSTGYVLSDKYLFLWQKPSHSHFVKRGAVILVFQWPMICAVVQKYVIQYNMEKIVDWTLFIRSCTDVCYGYVKTYHTVKHVYMTLIFNILETLTCSSWEKSDTFFIEQNDRRKTILPSWGSNGIKNFLIKKTKLSNIKTLTYKNHFLTQYLARYAYTL